MAAVTICSDVEAQKNKEGGTLQTDITGVCGECSQCFSRIGFAPAHGVCAFPVNTAQAPGCFAGDLSKVGPGLHALSRSKPLRFRFSGPPQRHRLGWTCVLCPSQVWVAQATRCLASTLSPGGAVCLITSPVPATQFPRLAQQESCLWGTDLWLQPSWLMSTVQDPRKTWLATGGLLAVWWRMPSLGPRLPLSGSDCRLPASLPPVGDGPSTAS